MRIRSKWSYLRAPAHIKRDLDAAKRYFRKMNERRAVAFFKQIRHERCQLLQYRAGVCLNPVPADTFSRIRPASAGRGQSVNCLGLRSPALP